MKIICWNIQKITAQKAANFGPVIGGIVKSIVGDEPFVFIVLENKIAPEATGGAIGTGLTVKDLISQSKPLGGASGVRENILFFAGNGATLQAPALFDGWRGIFNAKMTQNKDEIVAALEEKLSTARRGPQRDARSYKGADEKRIEGAKQVKKADYFRSPLLLHAEYAGEGFKFLALHSPGPGMKEEDYEPYAKYYAQAVLESADGVSLIIGDFNLRGSLPYLGDFFEASTLIGATTKGAEEGRHSYSRLDRVYCRRGFPLRVELFTDGPTKELTDHHCLVATTEKRAQRRLVDYFAFEESPKRRQEIRERNVKKTIDPTEARAKRVEKAEKDRHERRAQKYHQKRLASLDKGQH